MEWTIFNKFSDKVFRFFETFNLVLAQWKFLGDSEFANDSKKLYEYMQEKRYMLMKQLYTYRNSEREFDKSGESNDENRYIHLAKHSKECAKNDVKFSYSNYLNQYRISVCDFVEYPPHDFMDIMVYTNNRDAVIISTSLTST